MPFIYQTWTFQSGCLWLEVSFWAQFVASEGRVSYVEAQCQKIEKNSDHLLIFDKKGFLFLVDTAGTKVLNASNIFNTILTCWLFFDVCSGWIKLNFSKLWLFPKPKFSQVWNKLYFFSSLNLRKFRVVKAFLFHNLNFFQVWTQTEFYLKTKS